jgi:type II secretory pathway pseudopilin PulG
MFSVDVIDSLRMLLRYTRKFILKSDNYFKILVENVIYYMDAENPLQNNSTHGSERMDGEHGQASLSEDVSRLENERSANKRKPEILKPYDLIQDHVNRLTDEHLIEQEKISQPQKKSYKKLLVIASITLSLLIILCVGTLAVIGVPSIINAQRLERERERIETLEALQKSMSVQFLASPNEEVNIFTDNMSCNSQPDGKPYAVLYIGSKSACSKSVPVPINPKYTYSMATDCQIPSTSNITYFYPKFSETDKKATLVLCREGEGEIIIP